MAVLEALDKDLKTQCAILCSQIDAIIAKQAARGRAATSQRSVSRMPQCNLEDGANSPSTSFTNTRHRSNAQSLVSLALKRQDPMR